MHTRLVTPTHSSYLRACLSIEFVIRSLQVFSRSFLLFLSNHSLIQLFIVIQPRLLLLSSSRRLRKKTIKNAWLNFNAYCYSLIVIFTLMSDLITVILILLIRCKCQLKKLILFSSNYRGNKVQLQVSIELWINKICQELLMKMTRATIN